MILFLKVPEADVFYRRSKVLEGHSSKLPRFTWPLPSHVDSYLFISAFRAWVHRLFIELFLNWGHESMNVRGRRELALLQETLLRVSIVNVKMSLNAKGGAL